MVKKVSIPLSALFTNVGQIEGLPPNPRLIKDEKFEALKKSLTDDPEMLDLRELIVYPNPDEEGTYVVIGGNMRYNAAKELGLSELPCKILPESTPVEKMRSFIIKDNIAYGEWDMDLLADDWDTEELADLGLDLSEEWGDVSDLKNENEYEDDLSAEDIEQVEPVVRYGEIWKMGEHRLMCGDSTNADSMSMLMCGEKADMVFTDPPYGVSIGDKNKMLNGIQKARRCCENIENDNIKTDDLYKILVKAMTNCRECCKENASYYVTSPQGGELGLMMMMMMKDAGLPVRHMLIWEKNSATFSLGRLDYDYQHEPIFYTWTKSHKNYRKGEYRTTIWKYDKPRKCDLHPTMKPIRLIENCLNDATVIGDSVLDIFGGSGSTLIACEQLGRKCYMMEISPHYCDVIIARWETLTGLKAEKLK